MEILICDTTLKENQRVCLAWIRPYGYSELKLSWFLLNFFLLFYFQRYFCFPSFVLRKRSHELTFCKCNWFCKISTVLCSWWKCTDKHQPLSRQFITHHSSDWVPEWRSCQAHPMLSLPRSQENKGKIREDFASTGAMDCSGCDDLIQEKNTESHQAKIKRTSQSPAVQYPASHWKNRTHAGNVLSLHAAFCLSALICNSLFYWIFTYFHASKSHSLQ